MKESLTSALRALYGDGVRDLTAQGYFEALAELRSASPAEARRVERALAPLLEERFFPRRRKAWHQSSQGPLARLILLPDNPHIEKDIRTVRKTLTIPDDQIKPTADDPLWKEVSQRVKPARIRRIVEGNLAGAWLHLHLAAAMGQDVSTQAMGDLLSDSLRQSAIASARVDLRGKDSPDWLRIPPSGLAPYDGSAAPLDWTAGRLVERHRLLWSTARALGFYVLTENPEWVTGLEPLRLEITYRNDSGDPEAFTVCLKGIDEFVTEADWQRVWQHYIKPRQDNLWERRGMKPHGRRSVDILRLQKALPLYRNMVQQDLGLKEILRKRRPESKYDKIDQIMTESDQETIRRTVHDLQKLLAPAP